MISSTPSVINSSSLNSNLISVFQIHSSYSKVTRVIKASFPFPSPHSTGDQASVLLRLDKHNHKATSSVLQGFLLAILSSSPLNCETYELILLPHPHLFYYTLSFLPLPSPTANASALNLNSPILTESLAKTS